MFCGLVVDRITPARAADIPPLAMGLVSAVALAAFQESKPDSQDMLIPRWLWEAADDGFCSSIPIPSSPNMAHSASPVSDASCSMRASRNPPVMLRRIVSAKTAPGAALKIRPSRKAAESIWITGGCPSFESVGGDLITGNI